MIRVHPLWLLAGALALGGCGTKNLASKIAPTDPSAAEALGQTGSCSDVGAIAEPFVVDLRGTERSYLEAAMSEGVAVVHYDCGGLRLVKGCHVRNTDKASYAYTGVSIKEDVVQIKNADELRANLPASAVQIAAELSSGVSLDIAMMMIGRRNTVLDSVARDQLDGPGCAEATHFVRSAIVGAFAVEKGSVGHARAAAEVFGAGVSARSDADRKVANRDGVPDECKVAKPGDAAPPGQCRAAITLELYPVVAEAPEPAAEGDAVASAAPAPSAANCPPGMVRTGSMCAKPSPKLVHRCKPNDPAECQRMCDGGDRASCFNLGLMFESGRNGLTKDAAAAEQLYLRGCDDARGEASSCLAAATIATRAKAFDRAQTLLQRSCDGGAAQACMRLGGDFASGVYGKRDGATAQRHYGRACSLGLGFACSALANSLMRGQDGAPKDVERGLQMLHKSCTARQAADCQAASLVFSAGKVVPKDLAKALSYDELGCAAGNRAACRTAGERLLDGAPPVVADTDRARPLLERGCPAPMPGKFSPVDLRACQLLHRMFTDGLGVAADPIQAQAFLERACASRNGCAEAAAVYQQGNAAIAKDLDRALALLRQGCPDEGYFEGAACLALGKQIGKQDKSKARALYLDRCTRSPIGGRTLCKAYLDLGGKKSALVDGQGRPISLM